MLWLQENKNSHDSGGVAGEATASLPRRSCSMKLLPVIQEPVLAAKRRFKGFRFWHPLKKPEYLPGNCFTMGRCQSKLSMTQCIFLSLQFTMSTTS